MYAKSMIRPLKRVGWAMKGLASAAALSIALLGCGGGGSDDPGTNDSAASVAVSRAMAIPLSHTYTSAGTYTVTVSGQYAVTTFFGPDSLQVSTSYSGQGSISGNPYPTYTLSSNGQVVTINQTVTVVAAGTGPWELEVSMFTGTSAGTMTNLNMHTAKD